MPKNDMPTRRDQLDAAAKYLAKRDPVLRPVIRRVGPCQLPRRRNHFATLTRSIVSQQISTAAARSIQKRLEVLLAPSPVTAESLSCVSAKELRAVGLSRQKTSYLLDLAARTESGQVSFRRLAQIGDEAVITELTQVKGVGRWTAEMLLIFSLGRLDVLPCDDLGIRQAIRVLYGLSNRPDRRQCEAIGESWRPYASVASWYCWRSLELREG